MKVVLKIETISEEKKLYAIIPLKSQGTSRFHPFILWSRFIE